jgi:UDP:flavonoid glycosyltransferase YjiC (YdhE family)
MHIGLFTIGSRGDVQPFVALALGLKKQGHQVTLATHANFRSFVEGYGVDFFELPGDTEGLLHTETGKEIVRTGNVTQFLRHAFNELHGMRVPLRERILECFGIIDVAVVNCTMALFTNTATEKANKPQLFIQLNPPNIPTREFAALDLDWLNWPWFNRISYSFFNELMWLFLKKDVNEWRKELGLPRAKVSLMQEIFQHKIPIIHAFSPELIARPKDWAGHYPVTGFLTLPYESRISHPSDEIPESLKIWLENGPAPIYMGFGSIPIPDADRFIDLIEQTVNGTGKRIVLCAGWSRFKILPTNPNIYFIERTNHEWLMPLCSAGLVHGGIGSLAALLRAGKPAIVCSLFADQPIWGKLIEKKGLGVHIPWKKLNALLLMNAINAVSDQKIIEKAAFTGEKLQKETGIENALREIEKYFNNPK